MSYTIYTAEYHGNPNHVRLFMETQANGDGVIFHVIGTILNGMTYETKPGKKPDDSASYVPKSKVFLGTIKQEDLERLEAVCRSVEPPAKQTKRNGAKIDPSKPLRRCADWVLEVIDELCEKEILQS